MSKDGVWLPGPSLSPSTHSADRPPPSPVSLSLSLHFSSVDWPPSSSTPPGVARGQARRRRRPSRRPLPSLSPPTPLSLARARAHHRRRDGTGRLGLPASGSSPASLPPDSPPSSSPRIRPAPTGSTPPPCARRWGAGRRRPGGTAGGLAAAIGFGLPSALGTQAQGPGDVVAGYYQQLLEMLGGFNEMDTLTDRGFLHGMSKEERDQVARSEKLAIQLSNIANMVLFAAKVYASIRSGSLAIIASTLDSLLDLLSGFILWFTAFSMQTPNPYRYLIGKRRMQALRILVFASVMATLGLRIILESICSLLSDGYEFHLTNKQGKWVVDIMLSVTLVKLLLVIYCRSFTNEIVKAYAQDHLFDVITNVIGLVAALLANYVEGWIDPVGAIIRSIQSGHGR